MLARRWPIALTALFLLGLVWRLAYLARLAHSPLAGTLRLDERDYWDWASYLLGHGFRGTNPFFLGPFYPFTLAVVRAAVGSSVEGVLVVQSVWGAASAVLIADASRRLTRPAVALAIGVVISLCELAVLYDGLVLMESLLFFLEALLIWLWCRAYARPAGSLLFLAIGAVAAAIAQCRATGSLLLIPSIWVAMRTGASQPRVASLRAGLLCAVFLLSTAASAAWNWSVSREVIPFTYNFGWNLYVGNNPLADGTYVDPTTSDRIGAVPLARPDGGLSGDHRDYLRSARGLELTPAQSSSYWGERAFAYARHHPLRVLALMGRKLALMFNVGHIPQIENVVEFRQVAGPIGLPWSLSLMLLGVTGIVGLFVRSPTAGPDVPVKLYVVLLALGTMPFFVTDRYRIHLLPGLALLSAVAVREFAGQVRSRRPESLLRMSLAGMGGLVLIFLPMGQSEDVVSEWKLAGDLGIRWPDQGRPDLALHEFERAYRMELAGGLSQDPDPSLTSTRALYHFDYGAALRSAGREEEAFPWLARAAVEEPCNATYVRTLADACLVGGRAQEADSLLQALAHLPGGRGEALVSRGWEAAREGRLSDAESLFRQAISDDDRLFGAWGALIRVQVQQGQFTAARATWEEAARTTMPWTTLRVSEALVDAAQGDSAGAMRVLAGVPPEATANDPTLMRVVGMTRELMSRPSRPSLGR